MLKSSIIDNIVYNNDKPSISVLMETEFSKEIRIVFKAGQEMKEHKTAFPITVEMFEGDLDFGVNGEVLQLKRGDLLALEGNIPHNLSAKSNCIVRLTLTKSDDVNRVRNVVK
jgi:quercetin dioxygenase-like cupin family protein